VSGFEVKLADTRAGRAWFRPHGVMAVVGPFNFPAHLPNGHIIPALATGNTVVLKPSDKTPGVGQMLIELLQEALDAEGAPAGVVNLVQGAGDVASALVTHADLDGVLFTGSWPVGRRIMEANLDRPGRILALEMGGNNAAVILPDADLKQAVIECVRCAFITAGQRCTCTRRLIVHRDVADKVIPAIAKAASNLVIGEPDAAHPVFMGPVIGEGARQGILDAQATLARAGGQSMMACAPVELPGGGWYVSPGIMRVDRFTLDEGKAGSDVEIFGPFLRVAVVDSLEDAIEQANATRYGLAASIFTKDQRSIETFLAHARAGCVNVNTGTAGASSKLPFGGLGQSGNHRPAGAFSLDYCAYPVAGMIESGSASLVSPGMRFEDAWLGG
jgi:succinylglutamic semialdehyde dehydrogenase